MFANEPPNSLPEGCQPIETIMVTYWDNICGPKVEKVWTDKPKDPEFLLYISKHTLNGEMFRQTIAEIESKFYVLGDQGIAVTSFIFNGFSSPGNQNKFAVCIIVPVEYLKAYIAFYPIVLNRIPFMIRKLVAYQRKAPSAASTSSSLAQLNAMPNASTTTLKPQRTPIEKLAYLLVPFAIDLQEALNSGLPTEIKLNDTIFGPLYENVIDKTFLKKVITSHIQTHGCTVIVGHDLHIVNTLILSLALFLSPADQQRCCLAKKEYRRYRPGFFIQGFSYGEDILDELSDFNLIQAPYPTTVIDLTQNLVQQVSQYNLFLNLKKERMDFEIEQLLKDESAHLSTQPQGILNSVKEPSQFVHRLITEVYRLPHCLRLPYISQSNRLLTRKAVALIKYVECEMSSAEVPIPSLAQPTLKKIMQDLSLSEQSLFLMVLGVAEKLQPGTYHRTLGDPLSMEDKFREMIDSF